MDFLISSRHGSAHFHLLRLLALSFETLAAHVFDSLHGKVRVVICEYLTRQCFGVVLVFRRLDAAAQLCSYPGAMRETHAANRKAELSTGPRRYAGTTRFSKNNYKAAALPSRSQRLVSEVSDRRVGGYSQTLAHSLSAEPGRVPRTGNVTPRRRQKYRSEERHHARHPIRR